MGSLGSPVVLYAMPSDFNSVPVTNTVTGETMFPSPDYQYVADLTGYVGDNTSTVVWEWLGQPVNPQSACQPTIAYDIDFNPAALTYTIKVRPVYTIDGIVRLFRVNGTTLTLLNQQQGLDVPLTFSIQRNTRYVIGINFKSACTDHWRYYLYDVL